MAISILIFVVATGFIVAVSWRSLGHPRSHGFYRFFAFEGALILLLLNAHAWFRDPLSLRQLIAWGLLLVSAVLPILGFHLLRVAGGPRDESPPGPDYRFERTTQLVTGGIYRYIRHPMYASLFYLVWGAFLKEITWVTLTVAAVTTFFIYMTARVEERENLERFGKSYEEFMGRTRMFIPYIW
ncbi:MAG: isoprenylcysteine carboxylmethyltransferase family protein [Bacteroidota bacterium]